MLNWHVEEVTNQTIFREMNEWTEEDADDRDGERREMDLYLCECGDAACSEPIALTRTEYEAVRSVPVRFVIAVNHENPELDAVVSEFERYAVVDKLPGVPAHIASSADPRR
jgi:hypothetical protein